MAMNFEQQIWAMEDELKSLVYCDGDDVEEYRQELRGRLWSVRKRIMSIKNCTLRLLLLKRIFDRKKWSVIASEMGYSESHIYKLRVLAVLALAGICDVNEETN